MPPFWLKVADSWCNSLSYGAATDRLRLALEELAFCPAIGCQIIRSALVTIPQSLLRLTSVLFLKVLIAFYGTGAVAAFTLVLRLHMVGCMPLFGIGNASAALGRTKSGSRQCYPAPGILFIWQLSMLLLM